MLEKPIILLVDDVIDNIRVLTSILMLQDYQISIATTGEEALESVKEQKPDLILLDVMLPDIDGFALLSKIYEQPSNKDIPVIFLTAKTEVEDKIRAFNLGAVDFITKPFYEEEVVARLNNHLKIKRSIKQVETQKEQLVKSIEYASKIQSAILTSVQHINDFLPDYFVFFQPRDIVSGDFYWIKQLRQSIYIAISDCTGHGVPGAFMSLLGLTFLNEVVTTYELKDPAEILDNLRLLLVKTLKQSREVETAYDGMDVALCVLNPETLELKFSGAFLSLYMIRNEQMNIIKGNRMPVGNYPISDPFTTHTVKLRDGDVLYMFTDGFPDQMGGEQNKKYKIKSIRNFLMRIHKEPMRIQQKMLSEEFLSWKGELQQTDDVLVFGFKVHGDFGDVDIFTKLIE